MLGKASARLRGQHTPSESSCSSPGGRELLVEKLEATRQGAEPKGPGTRAGSCDCSTARVALLPPGMGVRGSERG